MVKNNELLLERIKGLEPDTETLISTNKELNKTFYNIKTKLESLNDDVKSSRNESKRVSQKNIFIDFSENNSKDDTLFAENALKSTNEIIDLQEEFNIVKEENNSLIKILEELKLEKTIINNANTDLKNQSEEYITKLNDNTNEIKNLRAQLKDSMGNNRTLISNYKNKINFISKNNEIEINKMKDRLNELDKMKSILKMKFEKVKETMRSQIDINNQSQEMDEDFGVLKSKSSDKEFGARRTSKGNDELEQKLLNDEISILKDDIKNNEIENYISEIQRLNEETLKFKEEIKYLTDNINNVNNEKAYLIKDYNDKVSKLTRENKELTKEIVSLKKDLESSGLIIKENEKYINELNNNINKLKETIKMLSIEKSQIENEKKQINAKLTNEIIQLSNDLEENNNKMNMKLSEVANSFNDEKKKLNETINNLREENKVLAEKSNEKFSQIPNVKKADNSLNLKMQNDAENIIEHSTEIEVLINEKKELNKENEGLKIELTKVKEEYDQIIRDISTKYNNIEKLNKNIMDDNSQKSDEIIELRKINEKKLKEIIEKYDETAKVLNDKINELTEINKHLRNENNDLKESLIFAKEDFQKRFNDLENEFKKTNNNKEKEISILEEKN